MSLESFPRSEIDDEDRGKSLYDKVYSAASHIIQSFRTEEDQPNSNSPQQAVRTSVSSDASQPQIVKTDLTHSLDKNIDEPVTIKPSNANDDGSIPVIALQTSSAGNNGHSSRPELLRTSTTSSATVGVSAAQAVPMLPTVAYPVPLPNNTGLYKADSLSSVAYSDKDKSKSSLMGLSLDESSTVKSPVAETSDDVASMWSSHGRTFDNESMFSVNSASASRAYLASQYSRTRSRAAPGRLGREFWMKDDSATSCFNCNRVFSTFRRKHHCRVCGQIFCAACTELIDGERCGAPRRRVRCCRACEEALTSHSSSEDEGDLSFMSQIADDTVKWPDVEPAEAGYIDEEDNDNEIGAGHYGTNHSISGISSQGSFQDGYGESGNTSCLHGNENKNHESYSRLASPSLMDEIHYPRSFLGTSHHLSHFARPRSRSRSWSRSQSQPPRDEDFPISTSRINRSNSNSTALSTQNLSHKTTASVSNSTSAGYNTTAIGSSALVSTINTSTLSNSGYASNAHHHISDELPLSSAQFPNSATVELNNASLTYLQLFLDQLLRDSELDPEEWKPVLTAPLLEVASGLHLEINDKLSPREWVKIKRIPGGTPQDIDTINGTVFTHSVARTSMSTRIQAPRILLIAFPIAYTRNERYMSLEPVVAQEKEYLRKLVDRIISLKPNILLSCSHVCGPAMDMLESAGVCVAQNVRESAVFRLSKITTADILMSIDRLSAVPLLGTCKLFEQRSYRSEDLVKTFLFFFVGYDDPGRCALVRGDSEISGVIKVVFEVMAEICYSLKAETALMRDQFVTVPSLVKPPDTILSSSPFVDYGVPYLLNESRELENSVIKLSQDLENVAEHDLELHYILDSQLKDIKEKWLSVTHLWESIEILYPFMFNPSSHQNLVVLYSLVCTETATPCVGPDAQLIEFYLNTDKTLGKFVESSIEQINVPCPDGCQRTMCDHHRTYVNGNGKITIWTEKMPCKISGLEESILMWSYCKICDQQMPIAPMSSTTWKCSMGKYLELSFYGEPLKMRASTCTHNVYRDHVRFFGWHGYALKIEYSTVALNEIYGPPKVVLWNPKSEIELKKKTFDQWYSKLERFWQSLLESLSQVKVEGLEESMIETSQKKLRDLSDKAKHDREDSLVYLTKLYHDTPPYDHLTMNIFLDRYQLLVDQWHADIADFDGQFFPSERDIRRVTAQHIRGLLGEEGSERSKVQRRSSSTSTPSSANVSIQNVEVESTPLEEQGNSESSRKSSVDDTETPVKFTGTFSTSLPSSKASHSSGDHRVSSQTVRAHSEISQSVPRSSSEINDLIRNENSNSTVTYDDDIGKPEEIAHDAAEKYHIRSPSSVMVKSQSGNDINVLMPGLNQSNSTAVAGGRVAILARHFEELSREFERERQKEKQRLEDRQRAIRMRHAHPIAEVFEDVSEAIEDWPQQKPSKPNNSTTTPQEASDKEKLLGSASQLGSSDITTKPYMDYQRLHSTESTSQAPADRVNSEAPASNQRRTVEQINASTRIADENTETTNSSAVDTAGGNLSNSNSSLQDKESEAEEIKKAEPVKLSLIRTLANFWAERSSTRWNGIEYILGTHQHYFTNSPVVLRENEPSSLIAFCLSLPDYQSRVNEFYQNTPGILSDELTLLGPDSAGQSSDIPKSSPSDSESLDNILEQAMLRQTGTHMRYHFDRNNLKVSCKIFFSEQFDSLRQKCSVSDKYIQSLSRCNTWESTGGKSGSAFLKTLDDRLILKELSHAEFDAFVNFAPSYFEYISQALFHDLPTVLAKLFGVYQITMRNMQTSQQVKMYVIVMENLFYNAKFSKFFDLKGSMRNRKVTETGKANEVLLDENMVEYIYDTPVFVREHSKRMLRASLYNDTLFLTKMNIMDYSLVIGLDDDNNIIVAGIIDYIRTYTWDKKIESWVKTRAATVGVKEPTVVSPKQYKGRFRESMERYFVMVPDCWSQQTM